MPRTRRNTFAFTLVELLVVLGLVIFVATMSMPNIARVMRATADAQAYNLMAAALKSARTVAIRDGVYACLHHQLANAASPGNSGMQNVSFVAVLTAPPTATLGTIVDQTAFNLGSGQAPQRIPGTMTFGEIRAPSGGSPGTFTGNSYDADGIGASGTGQVAQDRLNDFTTFNLVFTPSGGLTKRPNKQDVFFSVGEEFEGSSIFGGLDPLWDIDVANEDTDKDYEAGTPGGAGEPGAEAITMFDYALFTKLQGAARKDYLDNNAQLMPINFQLGMLVERR